MPNKALPYVQIGLFDKLLDQSLGEMRFKIQVAITCAPLQVLTTLP